MFLVSVMDSQSDSQEFEYNGLKYDEKNDTWHVYSEFRNNTHYVGHFFSETDAALAHDLFLIKMHHGNIDCIPSESLNFSKGIMHPFIFIF